MSSNDVVGPGPVILETNKLGGPLWWGTSERGDQWADPVEPTHQPPELNTGNIALAEITSHPFTQYMIPQFIK